MSDHPLIDESVQRFAANVYEAWQRGEGPRDPHELLRSAELHVEQLAREHFGVEVVATARLDVNEDGSAKLGVRWSEVR